MDQKLVTLKRLTLVQSWGFLSNIAHPFFRACGFDLILSIFGHRIGVLKSPALFQEKELQVTRFKVMCFWVDLMD